MARDPEHLAHQEWLGYVQPVGLVVSIPALLSAQAHVNRNIAPQHAKLMSCLPRDKHEEPIPEIRDFAEFTRQVLGWRESDLERVVPGDPRYAALEVHLPEYHETLRPTYVVREYEPKDAEHPWMLLIQSLPADAILDKLGSSEGTHWQATPHAKFERLLRETKVPIGLLAGPSQLRLVYAPRGETSGYLTFGVAEMAQVAGRPLFAALHMLLSDERLFSLGEKQRLPAILADSRKYQNHVSNELAQQVLAALYELLRGFQAADDATKSELLRAVLAADPNHVYGGLLTVLMRLVFLLYAEDRDLVSSDSVYTNHYSVTGLFERLRADASRYPDTMDQRFGAWAQLLTLFRLIYEGGSHGPLKIPARKGYLFDPDRYNFLEGRAWRTARRQLESAAPIPRVSDGVVFRVLQNLLILDGERLSYRTLDVEQIGGVYETMMGFEIEVARGRSIAVKPKKPHGAPATINLETLLATKPAERVKWLKANADQDLTGQAAAALKEADTIDDLLAALDRKIAKKVTPNVMSKGAMVFQPSDERRKSGSHYTPRTLTEPIVRTTLRPILAQLGEQPTPQQLLDLKVCDPAMGSGAFLVEACRQLGDELVRSWAVHSCVPKLPPDEDELLHARRLIAQRCLYGVDKNPMAVDLSKLSLWLATLAKDHPFTFLDHSLRAGDSLVGLSREQIAAFHWSPPAKRAKDDVWFGDPIAAKMQTVTEHRQRILASRDDKPYDQLRQELDVADEALSLARLTGDCVIAAYFSAGKDRERVAKLDSLAKQMVKFLGQQGKIEDRQPLAEAVAELYGGEHPLQPFHWEIEFPEVFTVDAKGKPTGGFDAIVGNPPFMGGTLIGGRVGLAYHDYLVDIYPPATGLADIVAFFLRQSLKQLRPEGAFGLIATNTVAQGDTRTTGLEPIVRQAGSIYQAVRRLEWPGDAAVVVSLIYVSKGQNNGRVTLDGAPVDRISAFLLKGYVDSMPIGLFANKGICFRGTKVWGAGFVFEENPSNGSSPLSEMELLISRDERNSEVIFAYMGGEEFNSSPTLSSRRFVIDFGSMSENVARRWPALFAIVEERVRPVRSINKQRNYRENWWLHANRVEDAAPYLQRYGRLLAISCVSRHISVAFVHAGTIVADSMIVFLLHDDADFAVIQSRIHEVWARLLGSSMKDDLRYTTACFDTFPLPVETDRSEIRSIGARYQNFRSEFMKRKDQGLTTTYNQFHDPDERSPDIRQLRELHAAMDRAVLEAYGWHDLAQTAACEFLLDYEEEDDDEESTVRRRKKPWRYRWPDDFRDEVLARLLALNAERAEQERLVGEAAVAEGTRSGKKSRTASKAKRSKSQNRTLFDDASAEGDA